MTARFPQAGGPFGGVDSINGRTGAITLPVVSIEDYGGVGDGTTDNADAYADAFDDVPVLGGELLIPPGRFATSEPLLPPSNCSIRGTGAFSSLSAQSACRIESLGGFTGPLIYGDTGVYNVSVEKVGVRSGSADATTVGIEVEDCNGWMLRDVFVEGFRRQGFLGNAGTDLYVDNMWLLNCMVVRTGHSDYIGVFEHHGADAILHSVRSTASISTDHGDGPGGPGSGYIAGIYLGGDAANAHMTSCYGHISQTGIVLEASKCHISSCRTDINEANGWLVVGSYNRFMGCSSYRDGQGADASYDGMGILGEGNVIVGFQAEAVGGDTNALRHAIVDANQGDLPNQIVAPQGIGNDGDVVYSADALVPPEVIGET